ncbi:MAG: hypothetical protein ACREIV_02860, partial [Planctomycetaceae bacterium]
MAVQLGAAGATVYVTGRTTRSERSEMDRPETIEETAALVDEAGGRGIAVQVDHLLPSTSGDSWPRSSPRALRIPASRLPRRPAESARRR